MPTYGHDQQTTDAAWNACAVASVYHREALDTADRAQDALVHVVDRARTLGLTTADVCAATGLDEQYLTELALQVEVQP